MGVDLKFKNPISLKEIEEKTDITIDNVKGYDKRGDEKYQTGNSHLHLGADGTYGYLYKDDKNYKEWHLTEIGGSDAVPRAIRTTLDGPEFSEDGAGFGWEYFRSKGEDLTREEYDNAYKICTESYLKGIPLHEIKLE